MSVHGEYSRALEALLSRLKQLDGALANDWVEQLSDARMGRSPDLSTAARNCLRVLEAIDAAPSQSASAPAVGEHDPLRELFEHLRAHCRIVLGIAESTTEP